MLSKEPNMHVVSSCHTTCMPRACPSFALNHKPDLLTFVIRWRKWIVSFTDHSPLLKGHITYFHYNYQLVCVTGTFGSKGQTLKEQKLTLPEEGTKWPWESLMSPSPVMAVSGPQIMLTASVGDVGLNFWHKSGIVRSCRRRPCSDGLSSERSVSITSDTWSRQGGILVQFSCGVNREK